MIEEWAKEIAVEGEGLIETQAEAVAKDDQVVIQEAKGTPGVAQVVQLFLQAD